MSNNQGLTDTLSSPTQGKSVVQAAPPMGVQSNSFISGLSRFGSGFADALSTQSNQAWQQDEQNYVKGQRDATNATAGSVYAAIEAHQTQLTTVSKGEQQGKLPEGSTVLHLDNVVSDLLQRFPEQKDTVLSTLKANGWDHYLAREVETQRQADDALQTGQIQQAVIERDAAVKAGVAIQGESDDATRARGRQLLQANATLDAAAKAADLRIKNLDITEKERKMGEVQGDKDIVRAIGDSSEAYLAPITGTLSTWIQQAAAGDTKMEGNITQAGPIIQAAITSHKADALAQARKAGATPDALKQISDQFDNAAKDITSYYTGDLSMLKTREHVRSNLENTFGITAMQSFPLMKTLTDVFGPQAIAEWSAGNPLANLPKEVQDGIKDEMKGLVTDQSSMAHVHMMNIKRILQGDTTHFRSLTPQEIGPALQGSAMAVQGGQQAVISGVKDADTLGKFTNGYGTVVNAAADITVPTATPTALQTASKLLNSKEARIALDAAINNPVTAESAKEIVFASRSATANLYEAARKSLPDSSKNNQFQHLQYNPNSGKWEVFVDKKAYDKWAAEPADPVDLPGTAGMTGQYQPISKAVPPFSAFQRADPALAQKVQILNSALDHLSETTKYDSSVPKGLTPLQIRNHYADPAKYPLKTATGEDPNAAQQQSYREFDKWLTDLQKNTIQTGQQINTDVHKVIPSQASAYLQGQGLNRVATAGIVGNLIHESGLDPSRVNPEGGDTGLAQWRGPRLKALQEFATANKADWHDGALQLSFLNHELQANPDLVKALNGAKTPEEASDIFMMQFEKPKGSETGDVNKTLGFNERRQHARGIFAYGG